MKKFLCGLLCLSLLGSLTACRSDKRETELKPYPEETKLAAETLQPVPEEGCTYREALFLLSDNWNPHRCSSSEADYPNQYLGKGLYSFFFNDELHPVEGKKAFETYTILPEMAADFPEDVTEAVKKAHAEFEIPEDASQGYAYTIDLNSRAVWENGIPIDAHTYAESMRRLLDPRLNNYMASRMYSGDLPIAGAEAYANQGKQVSCSLREVCGKTGKTPQQVLSEYGDQKGYFNWLQSFGAEYDFASFPWQPGQPVGEKGFTLPARDASVSTALSVSQLYEFVWKSIVLSGVLTQEAQELALGEVQFLYTYPENVDFTRVGIFASGDYQLTLVFSRPLSGFNLLYALSTNWLVEPNLYDSCTMEADGVYTCDYGTSLTTTLSYGPYRLAEFQPHEKMRFERNDSWYGYQDEVHRFQDPRDGEIHTMYATDAVEAYEVSDAATQKLMFLQGQLSVYGLQPEDYGSCRSSEFCYSNPSEMVIFLILNGHREALAYREQAPDFDSTAMDLQTIALPSFRRALSLAIDKELFSAELFPARRGAYGIIGEPYICDPDTGTRYRDTDQGRKVLCRFYGADPDRFGGDLEAAANSVTGFDPDQAAVLLQQAYEEALAAGYITDADENGISDQTVTISYCLNTDNDLKTRTVEFLDETFKKAVKGTGFEGRIRVIKSPVYGNDWAQKTADGMADAVLAGWTGGIMNPFSLTELYTEPYNQYDGAWFDAAAVPLTLEVPVDGKPQELTLSLQEWSRALNGAAIQAGEMTYCFGEQEASLNTRLDILSGIEEKILETGNYIPLMQDASMHLLSRQLYYVVEESHPVMGRGGLAYLRYHDSDAQWAEYVKEQGGELKY